MTDEARRIAERYERRDAAAEAGRYARCNADVLASSHERQRAIVSLLKAWGAPDLSALDILEVGCGTGANLQELLFLGATPERLRGVELLPERAAEARRRLPAGVRIVEGDATQADVTPAAFDVVYQAVVFSSILDPQFQQQLADRMWSWVRPGGVVLWYDFTFDNPSNPDVRGVGLRRVRRLFPVGHLRLKRVTLAPPIARRVARIHPSLYALFNVLPLLRTHVLCLIEKP
jgi:SAM-dependent methyltransferase